MRAISVSSVWSGPVSPYISRYCHWPFVSYTLSEYTNVFWMDSVAPVASSPQPSAFT